MHGNELSGGGAAHGPPSVKRRVDRRARVHDENIASPKKVRQVSRSRVPNVVSVGIGHEQADTIAREATSFGRLASDELLGEFEVERVDGFRGAGSPVLQANR
jgi:hypothetical protein